MGGGISSATVPLSTTATFPPITLEDMVHRSQQRTLPEWAWMNPLGTELSLIGLLYLRCQRFNVRLHPINSKIKFIVGDVQFIDAFGVEKEGEPHVAVITLVGKEMLILHDTDPLFPSDSLITKIATLQK
jgi:hypothetical protein